MNSNNDTKSYYKALRNVLKKDPKVALLLDDLSNQMDLDINITGIDSKLLYGNKDHLPHSFELKQNEIVYGSLNANNKKGKILADNIMILVSKELDKRKIGNEVLGLYREINMIYDFSEKISEIIEEKSIAEMALREASQIIDSTHGLFLIYDSNLNKVVELASFGKSPNRDNNISRQNLVIHELIIRGTSSIVSQDRINNNPALSHLKAVMHAPLKVKHRTMGIVILGHSEEKEFTAAELKLLTTIALQSAVAIESANLYQKGLREAKEREKAIKIIHEASQKFVPNEFIKSLGKTKLTEVALGDLVEKNVTVMFMDIRGFTTLSEDLNPKDNFLFINSFNKRMGPIIRKNKGFIMQYLGDGFMALFPNGSQNALRASVEMLNKLKEFNNERIAKNRFPIKIGIGMQNGNLIMGITGDIERLDAAIISDTVNTASRIEGLSKHFGASILLTKQCKDSLTNPEEFDFRYLGKVKVKGKNKQISIFECINGDNADLLKHKLDTLNTFNEGMDLYFNKEFAMAAVTFQKIVKMNRNDHTAKLLLNRSAHLITQKIDDDWKGVESITTK
ncbi:MAG: GAF domain-containing protein [Flavobacteriaceae bacterium]|nr:GAF domain-containing protein [Flavobacteriaceae bacterium]